MPKGPVTLSPRQRAFARAYATSANADALAAAAHAGYTGTPEQLRRQGNQLLRKYRIRQAIDRHIRKTQVAGSGRILKEMSDIATAPWRDFIEIIRDDEGDVLDVKMKLSEKIKAAEILLKVQGQLTDPGSRLMDKLMKVEILAMLRAQRQHRMKQQRLAARKAAMMRQLTPGSPGGPALLVQASGVEAGQGTSKPPSR